ncbi:uncharacterized protein LOC134251537 [Saccostrea cucullata]|uniref:uncharacterized protein LOC134251537 n=1 Tax=Saccostrea cuccullata TaxID=36930 RepID=UPI002ED29F3D
MTRGQKQKSVRVPGVSKGSHITQVTFKKVWVSDTYNNLVLASTLGEDLHHLTDVASGGSGVHTLNSDGELFYIDKSYNINKLSEDSDAKSTFIKYTPPWNPQCVYSSFSTGDLLVGMYNCETDECTAKLTRYNSKGENIQTIEHKNKGQRMYYGPIYITENRNGDIIVSDDHCVAVVVTDQRGKYRFSYTGPPSGVGLLPRGICTDAFSHILVCDIYTHTIHMIDKNGLFLKFLLTPNHGIDGPHGLSYDAAFNSLWVGSDWKNTVDVYRCVDSLNDLPAEKMKCKKHPASTAEKMCVTCDVPLCVECIISEEHKRHSIKEIHSKKGFDTMTKID